jgi:2-polyprenyl-3-methyl-5-hydroxy-6-metoxy-1,4-benzoquinol methylase
MKKWLMEILCNPHTGAKLLEESENILFDINGVAFPVCRGVPIFLGQHDEEETVQDFHYINHYTIDAEVFDYYRNKQDRLDKASVGLLQTSILKQIPKSTHMLLDVGCGCAYIAKHFMNTGVKVVSLDVAQANAEKALSSYPSENHASVVADAFALPFKENTFDCVVASEIIEHTLDPVAFIGALKRVLKPGGTLIVSTPYMEKIEYSLCIHCNCKTPKNAHLHSFDKNNMKKLYAKAAMNIDNMTLVGNKFLLYSRLVLLFEILGYKPWKLIDDICNKLVSKAQHFIIVSKKQI